MSQPQTFREWKQKYGLLDDYSENAVPMAKELKQALDLQLQSNLVDQLAREYEVAYSSAWNIIHDFLHGCINGDTGDW